MSEFSPGRLIEDLKDLHRPFYDGDRKYCSECMIYVDIDGNEDPGRKGHDSYYWVLVGRNGSPDLGAGFAYFPWPCDTMKVIEKRLRGKEIVVTEAEMGEADIEWGIKSGGSVMTPAFSHDKEATREYAKQKGGVLVFRKMTGWMPCSD